MRIAIETIYEHTDKLGDTIKVEKIKGIAGLIFTITEKDSSGGVSAHFDLSQSTKLRHVLTEWTNMEARNAITRMTQ